MPATTPRKFNSAQVEDLARGLREGTIERAQWSPHSSHLAVTVWHLQRYGARQALSELRAAIQSWNRKNGIEHLYHETVTSFYTRIVANRIASRTGSEDLGELTTNIVAELGTDKEHRHALWAEYYTDHRAVIASARARAHWVPPDKQSLPWPDESLDQVKAQGDAALSLLDAAVEIQKTAQQQTQRPLGPGQTISVVA